MKLPIEAVEAIDNSRGRMSRSDFICNLVRSHDAVRVQQQAYVTEEAFLEFQHRVKSLLRSFLDFVVTFALELGVHPDKQLSAFLVELRQRSTTDGAAAKRRDGRHSKGAPDGHQS